MKGSIKKWIISAVISLAAIAVIVLCTDPLWDTSMYFAIISAFLIFTLLIRLLFLLMKKIQSPKNAEASKKAFDAKKMSYIVDGKVVRKHKGSAGGSIAIDGEKVTITMLRMVVYTGELSDITRVNLKEPVDFKSGLLEIFVKQNILQPYTFAVHYDKIAEFQDLCVFLDENTPSGENKRIEAELEAKLAEGNRIIEEWERENDAILPTSPTPQTACCPRCKSLSITADKKGFGVGKAVVGAAVAGPIGLIAGNIGSKKVRVTCLNCGHQWMAGSN